MPWLLRHGVSFSCERFQQGSQHPRVPGVRENIDAVRKLVNRADKANAVDDTPQSLIANHRRQCVCEALSMDHAKWAIVVEARRRIERSCDGARAFCIVATM